MLFEIPIIVVLLQSIPEGFFIVIVGTKLFNIQMNFKMAAIIAFIYGFFAYLYRLFLITFGLHTLFSMILLVLLVKFIRRIPIFHSVVSILSSTLLIGVLQGMVVPIFLNILGISFQQLSGYPWINIAISIPIFLILGGLYYVLHGKGFYLYNLAGEGESIAKNK